MGWNGIIAGQCAFSYIYASSFVPQRWWTILSTVYMALDGLTMLIQVSFFVLLG